MKDLLCALRRQRLSKLDGLCQREVKAWGIAPAGGGGVTPGWLSWLCISSVLAPVMIAGS